MKICFLAGASVIHTVRWVNAMAGRGHEVHLITMHKPELDKIAANVQIYELKYPAPIGYYLNYFTARKIIHKLQPDILHVHYASGYGTLGRLIRYNRMVLSVWGSDVYLFPEQRKRNEIILRKNLAAVSQITSTSKDMKKTTERFVRAGTQIEVIPFGIDMKLFQPNKKVNKDKIVIGTVKRLEHIYGIDILIKATRKVIDVLREEGNDDLINKISLLIVGSGSEKEKLMQLAAELNMTDVTKFVGAIQNNEVPFYLNQFDIFCAFSRSESFGVAVLEASACAVPVVVSNVGGLPEVVEDGKTGYIVDGENMDFIVDRLISLVRSDSLRERFGSNGRMFVKEQYDWDENIKQMERVYKHTL